MAENGFGGVEVVVFSDRAHCSLVKAAALIGIGRRGFVQLGETVDEIEKQLKSCGPGTGRAAVVSLSYGEVNTVSIGFKVPASLAEDVYRVNSQLA